MSGQNWTPAPKKSAIPLHPMTFGMILGRTFASLRHNPKVTFGFSVAVQFVVTAIAAGVAIAVSVAAAQRIASVPPGSPDMAPIVAGTAVVAGLIAIAVTLASAAFSSLVQGLVAADVSFAALGRRASLRMLWNRVKPAYWRVLLFSVLQGVAVVLWLALLAAIALGVIALSGFDDAGIAVGILIAVLLLFGGVPLLVWLSTKLLVVPAALVLEHATLGSALVRSWRLIRGRFWVALGVMFIIGAVMGLATQVVSIPGSLISGVAGGIFAPTGDAEITQIVGLIAATAVPQVLVLAVQAVTLVVQATGGTLIYLDSRMRYEGLDQALIRFVERSAAGVPDDQLGDPYAVDPQRAVSKTPPPQQTAQMQAYHQAQAQARYAAQYGYPAQHGYPAQPQSYPAQAGYPPYGQQGYPQQAPPQYTPQPAQQYGQPPAPPQTPPSAPPQTSAAEQPPSAPAPWTAPGSSE